MLILTCCTGESFGVRQVGRLGWLCWPSDTVSAISHAVALANTVRHCSNVVSSERPEVAFYYEVLERDGV